MSVIEKPCRICGAPVWASATSDKAPRCSACGILAAAEAATQMRLKFGPYYEAWLRSAGPAGRRKRPGTPMPRRSVSRET